MRILKSLVAVSTSLLLAACANKEIKTEPEVTPRAQTVIKNTTNEKKQHKDYPHWLDKPELENHIAVVGTAGPQKWGGEQAQYLAAMEDAQKNLNTEFKKHQQAVQNISNTSGTVATDENIEEKIESLLLHKAIVKEEWIDPETSHLYLWLVLPGY